MRFEAIQRIVGALLLLSGLTMLHDDGLAELHGKAATGDVGRRGVMREQLDAGPNGHAVSDDQRLCALGVGVVDVYGDVVADPALLADLGSFEPAGEHPHPRSGAVHRRCGQELVIELARPMAPVRVRAAVTGATQPIRAL